MNPTHRMGLGDTIGWPTIVNDIFALGGAVAVNTAPWL
jgi:hypothetical protein